MKYNYLRESKEDRYDYSYNGTNISKGTKVLSRIFSICIVIGVISCIYVVIQSKSIELLTPEAISKNLSLNCNEKLVNTNIDYSLILQEYIDKIYGYVKDKNYNYLYLNLEEIYTKKVNISTDQMVSKLEQISKSGTKLNSYQKNVVDDKDCFVCKIGEENSLITIYEYKPGIYSFAFDGFIK